jgi:hypothetical protein
VSEREEEKCYDISIVDVLMKETSSTNRKARRQTKAIEKLNTEKYKIFIAFTVCRMYVAFTMLFVALNGKANI